MITCTFEDGGQASLRHVTVSCIVVKDSKLLLTKRSSGLLEAGKWCLPGGFADRDETTAGTGMREVLEETGWTVNSLQLLCIRDNPDRPHEDRQNIDFVYIAQAIKKTSGNDGETETMQWFPLDSLPPADQIAFDHATDITLYKEYLQANVSIPVIVGLGDSK